MSGRARSGRRGLLRHGIETGSNDLTGGSAGSLEVLGEPLVFVSMMMWKNTGGQCLLAGRSRQSSLGSSSCKGHGVCQGFVKSRFTACVAARFDSAAVKRLNGLQNTRRLGTIDVDLEIVRAVRQISSHRAINHNGDQAVRTKSQISSLGQVGGGGNIEFIFECLSGSKRGESLIGKTLSLETALDTFESDLGIYKQVSMNESYVNDPAYHSSTHQPSSRVHCPGRS